MKNEVGAKLHFQFRNIGSLQIAARFHLELDILVRWYDSRENWNVNGQKSKKLLPKQIPKFQRIVYPAANDR